MSTLKITQNKIIPAVVASIEDGSIGEELGFEVGAEDRRGPSLQSAGRGEGLVLPATWALHQWQASSRPGHPGLPWAPERLGRLRIPSGMPGRRLLRPHHLRRRVVDPTQLDRVLE